jgi:L-threonylcarbamoyladenylate synthase
MRGVPSAWQLAQTARAVAAGGVIAYPTEAVWGVGCDPWDAAAVYRLLALKDRPVEKGLILIAGHIDDFAFLLDGLPAAQLAQLEQSWPGPNTWLVPHHGRLPQWLCGQHPTIALRVTDHPAVQALCALTGPLVSTSANPAGRPAARSRLRVQQYFGDRLDGVLNAPLGGRKNPSLIRELATGRVVRAS